MGVANIDMYKRANVSSPLNATLDDLLKLKQEFAETALLRPSGKSAFDYGRAVGFYQCLGEVLARIENNLNEGPSARTSREES
jgi:hypothetical protein